jgi:DUF4097 and DUF4098 domain-containing protein YvlB
MKHTQKIPALSIRLFALVFLMLPAVIYAGGGSGANTNGEIQSAIEGEIQKEMNIETDLSFPSGQIIWIEMIVGGSIRVEGWDQEKISMKAEKSGRDSDLCIVLLEKRSGGARVLAKVPSYLKKKSINCSVDIVLHVPYESDVELNIMGGSIEIVNVEGRMSGRTMGGPITLEDLKGHVELTTMGGGIWVTRSDLSGTVKSMGGNVTLEDVSGDLNASTMGGMVIQLASSSDKYRDKSSGEVITFSTMGGEIEIEEAPAGVKAKTMGGSIHVASAGKFAAVETMGGDITIESIDGWVTATTMGGDVSVVMTGNPNVGERDVYISSKGGDIELTVPRGLSMNIDITLAYTKDSGKRYKIESDFDLQLEETDNWDRSQGTLRKYIYGKGIIGDGTFSIVIETINGNVYLKEGK